MTIYIIPEGVDNKDLSDTLARFGAPLLRPARLRDFILETQGAALTVSTLSVADLMVLNRHAATLLDEVPTVVLSIPGALYTSEWMSVASALPAIDWIELGKKLQKSGHTANNVEQLGARARGTEQMPPVGGPSDSPSTGKGFFGRRHQELPRSALDTADPTKEDLPIIGADDA